MDGLDGRLVQFADGLFHQLSVAAVIPPVGQQVALAGAVFGVQQLLQAGADAFRQLGGGGLGKGDGNDARHRRSAFDQGHNAADQGVGFPRTGASLHDEVGVQVVDDALIGMGVVSGRCHYPHSSCYEMAALPPRAL